MVLNVSTRKYHGAGPSAPEGVVSKANVATAPRSTARFLALCVAVAQEDEGLARLGPLGARPAGHPDRRSACRRPCLGGGDRRRWHRRLACPGPWPRGRRRTLSSSSALHRQSSHEGARSDAAPAVQRRWLKKDLAAKRSATPAVWPLAIQRCQVHKGRNIIVRLIHAFACERQEGSSVIAWDQDDADKAERLLRKHGLADLDACGTGRLGQHPGGAGRDPQRHPPRPAARTPALACKHHQVIEN